MRSRKDWALSAEQKMDARGALALLEGTGLTLEEAARRAIATVAKAEKRVPVDEAVATFLRKRREHGLRSSTLDWYGRELAALADALPRRTIDAVSRRDVRSYLDTRAPGVRPAAFRCVRALFRFAAQQEPPWVTVDPTRGMKVEGPKRDHHIPVLTVDQCKTLLDSAGEYRAALAVALFAGLRPEEIAGPTKTWLTWEAINEDARTIAVSGELAKTRRPGKLEGLPDTVWHWLATVEGRKGNVSPHRFQSLVRWARKRLGLPTWPKDVTRHTFATYAAHFTQDPGKVALWLRHEGDQRLLYRHYMSVNVSRADAKAFFDLRP